MQGLGWGEDTGKAGAAPDPSSVECQGGNSRHWDASSSGAQVGEG